MNGPMDILSTAHVHFCQERESTSGYEKRDKFRTVTPYALPVPVTQSEQQPGCDEKFLAA